MNTKPKYNDAPVLTFLLPVLFAILSGGSLHAAISESNLSKAFPVQPGGVLIMDVDRGSIQITTEDTGEVKVQVDRKVTRESSSKAAEIFAAHEVTFDHDGDRVEVHAKSKKEWSQLFNRGAQHFEVKYRVTLPSRFNLDLKTAAGEITSTDIEGNVKARTAGGSLKFHAVKGNVDGMTSAGSIELGSATGPVTVRTSGGSISLGKVDSETSAETSAGSISVQRAGAKLAATTHGGSLDLGELLGPAKVETSAGSIKIGNAKTELTAITHGGRIEAGELDGPSSLSTSAGEIVIKASHANVDAKTSGGGIEIGGAEDTVTAHTSAGSIRARFTAQPHDDCQLTTSGGGIELTLAASLAFDIDAYTGGGQINTQIPVETTVVGPQNHSSLKGKINGGGKALVLKTSAGNIELKKQ